MTPQGRNSITSLNEINIYLWNLYFFIGIFYYFFVLFADFLKFFFTISSLEFSTTTEKSLLTVRKAVDPIWKFKFGMKTSLDKFVQIGFNIQYMTNSTLVCPVKIEYVTKNNIFGLKMMVKSGLGKIFLKFLHAHTMSFLLLNL